MDAVTIYAGTPFNEATFNNSAKSFCQAVTGVEKFSQNSNRQRGCDKTAIVESSPDSVFNENPFIGGSAFPFLMSLSVLSLKVYAFRSAGRSVGENSNCFPPFS